MAKVNPAVVSASRAEVDLPEPARRISWGAIIAGVVISFVVMAALEMLGVAIGAELIEPFDADAGLSTQEFATAGVVWYAATILLSLFAGGWVASRMAAVFDETNGLLHGLVTWATVTLITLLMLWLSVNWFVGTTVGIVTDTITATGNAVTDVVPEAAQAVERRDQALQDVRAEIQEDVEFAEGRDTRLTRNEAANAVEDFLNAPEDATVRERAVSTLANNTDLTEAEINNRLDQWNTSLATFRDDADAQLEAASEDVRDVVSRAAGIGFMAMVLGAFAAGAGGWLGTRDDLVATLRTARVAGVPARTTR